MAWFVVVAVAIIMATAAGTGFYGSTIYIAALVDSPRSYSVTMVSLATGAFMLVSGLGGLVVARAMDRSGTRIVLAVGALVMAVALVALGQVRSDIPLILVYSVMGIGFAALTVVPAGRLVAAWFVERRTLAMSVAFMGLPLGGMVFTPVVSYLVENRGFTEAMLWLASGLVVVVLPLSVVAREPTGRLIDHKVPELPLVTDAGIDPRQRDLDRVADTGWVPASIALRSKWFIIVTLAMSLGMISQIGAMTHMYNIVSQVQGFRTAAAVISAITFASLAGRIIGSWGLEKFGLSRSAVLLLFIQSVSLVGIVLWRDVGLIFPAVIAFGLTLGNLQVIQPLLFVERFGAGQFSEILAVGNLFVTFGMAAGPLVIGFGADRGVGYAAGLILLACVSALSALLVFIASRLGGPSVSVLS